MNLWRGFTLMRRGELAEAEESIRTAAEEMVAWGQPPQLLAYPAALLAGGEIACREARRIVAALRDRPFIFNLGHGVLPQTDPAAVAALVEYVRSVRLPEPGVQ